MPSRPATDVPPDRPDVPGVRIRRRTPRAALTLLLGVVTAAGIAMGPPGAAADETNGPATSGKGSGALAATGTARTVVADHGPRLTGTTKQVSYGGVAVDVPESWQVVDLNRQPRACVRVDRHVVYLGTPAADQACPARILGRTEALLLAPATTVAGTVTAGFAADAHVGAVPVLTAASAQQGEFALTYTQPSLSAFASFGTDPDTVRAVLGSMRTTGGPSVLGGDPRSANPADGADFSKVTTGTAFHGYGFDTCAAPSTSTMGKWRASAFGSVGIYIGGRNRACLWGNLSASWVRTVAGQGWRIQPIYVGLQPRCTVQGGMTDISRFRDRARRQGAREARNAIEQARALGLYQGSTIFSDIEGYDGDDKPCVRSTMAYLNGWVRAMHDGGYLAGVYSSAYSAIEDLADLYYTEGRLRPDVVWTARWDGKATTKEEVLDAGMWTYRQRAKQYRGDHTETHGGVSIRIDSNFLNAMVASPAYRFRTTTELNVRTRATTKSAVVRTLDEGDPVDVLCQSTGVNVLGDSVWDKLSDGHWVSDKYVTTPSESGYSRPIPPCTFPYQTWVDPLRLFSSTSRSSAVQGTRTEGTLVHVVCQTRGQLWGNTRVWDRLASGEWVSNYNVANGYRGYVPDIPRCL